MIAEIKQVIENSLKGAVAHVSDPNQDGRHLEAVVIFEGFESMSLVKQHQLVMNSLKKHFATTLHALKLKTLTPEQYATYKEKV